jgi:hypothetical protein
MPYERLATRTTPALIIYLLDMSESMNIMVGEQTRSELVSQMLLDVLREMVRRSIKGTQPAPRYHVAAFAYNDTVHDVFGGARPITEVIQIGVPVMKAEGTTHTREAFEHAEKLLLEMRDQLADRPAPLVCHLTDGGYSSEEPKPVVERIQKMVFPDGPALVQNILFDNDAMSVTADNLREWAGVTSSDQLATPYARYLFEMSSPVPDSYLRTFQDRGYKMQRGARLFFPGGSPDMVKAAFTMSGMTPVA